jgi:hypothetical protein
MNKFQFKKEKLPPLTIEDIEDLGWTKKKFKENDRHFYFEKGNYFLSYHNYPPGNLINSIRIHAVDPTKIEWMPDPETFRITIPCPTREMFEIITSTL